MTEMFSYAGNLLLYSWDYSAPRFQWGGNIFSKGDPEVMQPAEISVSQQT